ncbi:MAG: hypothetical protein L0H84_14500 [Pseudonocardia sp.]|nr:hypothetical protein [Pseudonocardia sp.]
MTKPDNQHERAKEITDTALKKAAELAEKARERAPEVVDRVAELASKAIETATAAVDKATGGRFHEYLEAPGHSSGKPAEPAGELPVKPPAGES